MQNLEPCGNTCGDYKDFYAGLGMKGGNSPSGPHQFPFILFPFDFGLLCPLHTMHTTGYATVKVPLYLC